MDEDSVTSRQVLKPVGLLSLSIEVLERVASHLRSTSDLLSLALTNSTCHQLIRHIIPFRRIRCPLDSPEMWDFLSNASSQLRHVASLAINDSSEEWLPPKDKIPQNSSATWPIEMISALLERMPHLEELTWRRMDRRYSSPGPAAEPDSFWVALQTYCKNLKRVDVECTMECGYCFTCWSNPRSLSPKVSTLGFSPSP